MQEKSFDKKRQMLQKDYKNITNKKHCPFQLTEGVKND